MMLFFTLKMSKQNKLGWGATIDITYIALPTLQKGFIYLFIWIKTQARIVQTIT